MEQPTPSVPFWDAVRAWADSAGFLLPQPESPDGQPARPKVPESVCENCPICQGAATLDQVNPEVMSELAEVARNLLGGIGSALASAAEQRLSPAAQDAPGPAEPTAAPPSDPASQPPGDAGDEAGQAAPDGQDG